MLNTFIKKYCLDNRQWRAYLILIVSLLLTGYASLEAKHRAEGYAVDNFAIECDKIIVTLTIFGHFLLETFGHAVSNRACLFSSCFVRCFLN